MSKRDLPIQLRKPHKEDVPFIFSSWLHSYRSSLHTKNVVNTVYFGEHHDLLERIMNRSEAVIACNADDPNQIFGYIVYERIDNALVVHYIYVKQSFRKLGIGKTLLQSTGWQKGDAFIFTHDTYISAKLAMKYRAMFNPYVPTNHYQAKEGKENETSKN